MMKIVKTLVVNWASRMEERYGVRILSITEYNMDTISVTFGYDPDFISRFEFIYNIREDLYTQTFLEYEDQLRNALITYRTQTRTQETNKAGIMLKELSQEFGKSENDILMAALKLYKYVMEFKDEHE